MFRRFLENTRAMVTPVSITSSYESNGRLSVQEFIQAGDYLVNNWPLWSWTYSKKPCFEYLPLEKQYIRVSRVVSSSRVVDVYNSGLRGEEDQEQQELIIVSESPKREMYTKQRDIEIFESCEDEEVVLDDCGHIEGENDHEYRIASYSLPIANVNLRFYTIDITYDTYYATPRFWITGFDIYGHPLNYAEIMEDISSEHKHKTVTVENHPFLGYSCISIHPCMHSNLMFQFGPDKGFIDPTTSIIHLLPLLTTIMPTTDFVGLGC